MPRPLVALAAAFGAVLVSGCAGNARHNPFLVPQASIYGSVKTIALAPIVVPRQLGSVEVERAKFDSLITADLRAAGFKVVSASQTEPIWSRVTDSPGGLFDASTGERDSTKVRVARRLLMEQLVSRFQADALLHPHVVFATARFNSGTATWDGTRQSYQSFGGKLLRALFGQETYGKTPALSLSLDIENLDGQELYINQGGLQLYEKPTDRDFAPVPASELFSDTLRNATAVHLALGPLVTRGVATIRPGTTSKN